MPARQSQLKGRSRLGGLREHHAAIDDAMSDERQRFARLAGNDARPQVFTSFNLFPTPPELAARVRDLADIPPEAHVLEPSAGMGALVAGVQAARLVLVEIDFQLSGYLCTRFQHAETRCTDFLEATPADLGKFDRILMNPPFKLGADVKHISHARAFLRAGGRLVAICANGPRQRAALQPIASEWIDLPAGSFRSEGTNVAAAMLAIDG